MVQDLPNAAVVASYVDALWTVGVDSTAQLISSLLKQMEKEGTRAAVLGLGKEDWRSIKKMPTSHPSCSLDRFLLQDANHYKNHALQGHGIAHSS